MWHPDRTRRILSNTIGYFCIFIFFSITSYIVFIFYSKIAPALLDSRKYGKFFFHFIFGNWIMINIYFNYIMAWLTSPGLSKNYQNLAIQYPVCKKCSFSKPPRTHHCSWCDLCVLRYDHHCPWLNNCVGFYNHRYFYQFCCFMSIGCFYAGSFGYREYQISLFHMQLFRHIDGFRVPGDILGTMGIHGFVTYYIFIVAPVMGFLLLCLSFWHGRMIGRGETSVERLINQAYLHQYYQQNFTFVKMYRIDQIENWKRFLGIRTVGDFIQRVLLPSTHKPRGNGITMDESDVNARSGSNRKVSEKESTRYNSHGYHSIPGGYLVSKHQYESSSRKGQSMSNDFNVYNNSRTPLVNSELFDYMNGV